MNTKTNIAIEYAPLGLTAQGRWRPLCIGRFRSQEPAEKALEEYKANHARLPKIYEGCKEYKVMKRTVITTISEWENV